MDVGGKHREEEGDESPRCGTAQKGNQQAEPAGELGRAGDQVGRFLGGEPCGHHAEVEGGREKVIHTGDDEKEREHLAGGGSFWGVYHRCHESGYG